MIRRMNVTEKLFVEFFERSTAVKGGNVTLSHYHPNDSYSKGPTAVIWLAGNGTLEPSPAYASGGEVCVEFEVGSQDFEVWMDYDQITRLTKTLMRARKHLRDSRDIGPEDAFEDREAFEAWKEGLA